MYDTSGTQSVCTAYHPDYDIDERVSWLKAELAREEAAPAAARLAAEEASAAVMDEPRTPEQAYAALGLALGLLPPAAIFGRYLLAAGDGSGDITGAVLICLVMNVICCAVGCAMGRCFGRKVGDPRRRARHELMLLAVLYGFLWAVVTGGSGGAIVMGIGALFGIACAAPVAVAGFLLFAPLHRLLSRGGMIEGRHLRPLALGIAGAIAALILSPGIFQ